MEIVHLTDSVIKEDLYEQIRTLPVIDAHEHFYSHGQCNPVENVTDFVIGNYISSILNFTDQYKAEKILDRKINDRERWRYFVKLWPFLKYTGYGQLMRKMADRWGVSDFDEDSYETIKNNLALRSPAFSREQFFNMGIQGTITHYLGHPYFGGLDSIRDFMDEKLLFDEAFYPLLGTLPFHEFHQISDIRKIEPILGCEIHSLECLMQGIGNLVMQLAKRGVVGLKDHAAYTRGLAFGFENRLGARDELKRLLQGDKFELGARVLSDFLFHQIVRMSIEYNIPMVIHTGYLVGSADQKANLRNFIPVIQAYPEARFDLYHLNYPWFEDFTAVLKTYPNTYANCCWTHIIDQQGTIEFMKRAVCTIPINHLFGFGGDFANTPEPVVAHLEIALRNIAAALGDLVSNRILSRSDALQIARMWLYQNPSDFYCQNTRTYS